MKIKFGIDDLIYENELSHDIKDGEYYNFNVDFAIKDNVLYIDIANCISTALEAVAEEMENNDAGQE